MATNGTSSNDTIDLNTSAANEDVLGLGGNDVITTGTGADTIKGGIGADTVNAGSGNDVVYGNDGSEPTTDGADQLAGGLGNDSVAGDSDNDTIYGGRGTVDSQDGNDTLRGGGGNDQIYANAGDDLVTGNAGNDTIYGGFGSNVIYGDAESTSTVAASGDGSDFIYAGVGNDTVYGGGGNDTIYGGGSAVVPADGADLIFGGAGNDMLFGNGGSDSIDGGTGNDSIYGGVGDDVIVTGSGNDVIYLFEAGGGTKTITDFNVSSDRIALTSADINSASEITVTSFSGLGFDSSGGGVQLTAGGVSVRLLGVNTTQINSGNVGNFVGFNNPGSTPTVPGGTGGDTTSGGGGGGGGGGGPTALTRTFTSTAGETLTGGTLGDTFNGTAATIQSTDVVNGGSGTDKVKITGGGTVSLSGVTLNSVEEVMVNDGTATTITISTFDGSVTGGAGDDVFNIAIADLSTADTINGAADSTVDTLNLTGGGTLDFGSVGANVSNVEALTLAAATTITGGTANYDITGSTGNDRFINSAANLTSADTIDGNGGTDNISITGGGTADLSNVSDIDTLTLAAATTVTAGANDFNITGSTGSDKVIYAAANLTSADTVNGNGGTDVISITGGGSADVTNVSDVDSIVLASGTSLTLGTLNTAVTGSTGNDTFNVALSELTTADTIDGGAHSTGDTLNITGGGVIDFGTTLTNISNVEKITLAAATSITGNATDYDVTGSSGNDQFTYTAANMTADDIISGGSGGTTDTLVISTNGASINVTNVSNMDVLTLSSAGANTVTVGANNFAITGGTDNDTLIYAASNLTSADTVNGNGGTDSISITGGGSADVTNVSDVDTITLASGTSLTVGATNFNITGSGGNDTLIYAAANLTSADVANGVTGTDAIQLSDNGLSIDVSNMTNFDTLTLSSSGNNSVTVGSLSDFSITGGSGNDTLIYAGNALTANDVINGNGGTDTIQLNTAATTINTTNVSDVDNLTLANGTNRVTVGTNNFNITGGTGDDTFVYAASQLTSADSIDGGADVTVDTLEITGSGAIDLTNVSNVEVLDLTNMTGAVSLTGGGSILGITGTGFDDQFTYNDPDFHGAGVSLAGGAGTDTLIIKDTGAVGFTLDATDLDGTNTKEIENITFDTIGGAQTATVTLVNAFVDSATGDNVNLDLNNKNLNLDTDGLTGARTVTITGDGNNTITLTGTNNINIITGAGFNSEITLATGSTDEVTGGTGNDTIVAGDFTDLTSADSIVGGGTGTDVLVIEDGDNDGSAITATELDGTGANGGVSGFETVQLVIGTGGNANTYSIVLNDAFVTSSQSNAVTLDTNGVTIDTLTTTGVTGTVTLTDSSDTTVIATTANASNAGIAIGAGENSTITLGNNANTISGNNGDDTFIVVDNELTAADSLTGGTGADVLSITGSNGNVDFVATVTAVSGFEALTFDSDRITGTDTLVISDDLVTSATGTNLFLRTTGGGTIYRLDTSDVSSGEGDVVIDTGAAVTLANATNRVVIDDSGASARDVTILGGTGSDTFVTTNTSFTSADSITGGGTGNDILEFTDAATIDDLELANKSGIDQINLDTTGNTIELTDAFVGAADGATADQLTIDNGGGTLSLDASLVTTAANRVVIAGTGAVTLSAVATKVATGSAVVNNITGFAGGGDTIITKNGHLTTDTVTGGLTGTDTLAFDDATTLDFGVATNVTGFENLSFLANGSSITLSDAFVDATAGLTLTGTGNTTTYTVNTTAVATTKTITIAEGRAQLGATDDRVTISDASASVAGGTGDDALIFTDSSAITTADTINGEGDDFADAIIATNSTPSLDLTAGTTNFANVTNTEIVAITATGGTIITEDAVLATNGVQYYVAGGTLNFTSGTTAGSYIVLATGAITLQTGSAITLADTTAGGNAADVFSAAHADLASILTAYQTAGGASITAAGAASTIVGGNGNDSVNITAGTDTTTSVSMAAGNDTITVDNNTFTDDVTIDGGAGTNTVVFTDAVNITGDAATDGNKADIDVLRLGAAGNTIVLAANEADNLSDNFGALTIETGTAGVANTITSLAIDATGNAVTISGGLAATLSGATAATIWGNSTITMTAGGNDSIVGGTAGNAGNDTWTTNETALDGNDTLSGGGGTNILIINENGANGIDLSNGQFANLTTLETVRLGTVTAAQDSAITLGSNARALADSNVSDTLTLDLNSQDSGGKTVTLTIDASTGVTYSLIDSAGGTVIATLGAGSASKVSIGDADGSSITGGSSNDSITGGTGNDTFVGGLGEDTLVGGAGQDSFTGGGDGDRFDFVIATAGNNDVITDMTHNADVIRFSDAVFDFNAAVAGDAFTSADIIGQGTQGSVDGFSGGNFTVSQHFIYDRFDGQVWYDADGSGTGSTAVLILTIENFTTFAFGASDFAAIS